MSDRMPVEDVVGPAAQSEWECPRCGRANKSTWVQCPACESDRVGQQPVDREPDAPRSKTNPIYVLIGILVLVGIVVAAVLVAEPVWEWVQERWDAMLDWIDARS